MAAKPILPRNCQAKKQKRKFALASHRSCRVPDHSFPPVTPRSSKVRTLPSRTLRSVSVVYGLYVARKVGAGPYEDVETVIQRRDLASSAQVGRTDERINAAVCSQPVGPAVPCRTRFASIMARSTTCVSSRPCTRKRVGMPWPKWARLPRRQHWGKCRSGSSSTSRCQM